MIIRRLCGATVCVVAYIVACNSTHAQEEVGIWEGPIGSNPTGATHYGATNAGITTTIPGAVLSGSQDDWTITLTESGEYWYEPSSGYGYTIMLDEPDDVGKEVNVLTVVNATEMTWVSDVPTNSSIVPSDPLYGGVKAASILGIFIYQPDLTVYMSDGTTEYGQTLPDPDGSVPESSSFALLSLGLGVLFLFSRTQFRTVLGNGKVVSWACRTF